MSHRKTVLGDDPRMSGRERDRMREAWRTRQAKRGEPTGWRKLQFPKATVSSTDGPISVHGAQYNRPHGAPYGVEGVDKESFRGGGVKERREAPIKIQHAAENLPKTQGEGMTHSTTERLVAMMRERHARGLAKYGTTVDREDLTPEEWAQHAIEEMLDAAAYLMRLRDTMADARAKEAKP